LLIDQLLKQKGGIMTNQSGYQSAIVLQGGGASGAYEYGVLKALYEARPGFTPAVVTGVSIGAVTAAVLVGAPEDPIGALGELWETYFAVFGVLPHPVRPTAVHARISGFWRSRDANRRLGGGEGGLRTLVYGPSPGRKPLDRLR
jgi:predicted acylesterase/phospholipase RssA